MAENVVRPAFIILAHRLPEQVQRLVDYLLNRDCQVFLHIDKKSEKVFSDFFVKNENRRNLIIYCRFRISWGGFKQMSATLLMMKEALQRSDFTHLSLLSGQDLPLKSMEDFRNFLSSKSANSFLHHYPLPAPDQLSGNGGLDRLSLFWIGPNRLMPKFISDKLNVLIHSTQKLTGLKRSLTDRFYAGANWFTLNRAAVNYVLDFLADHPAYLRRFRFTRSADEILIQSILMNSSLASSIVNDHIRYIDWSENLPHPKTFRLSDAPQLLNSQQFFARKFDAGVDNAVIEKIYQKI